MASIQLEAVRDLGGRRRCRDELEPPQVVEALLDEPAVEVRHLRTDGQRPCKVVLHTDSEYVRNGISRWINGWVRNNWRNAAKDPVANMALWQRLLAAAKPHEVEWRWVRGHAGDPMNERADVLATEARRSLG